MTGWAAASAQGIDLDRVLRESSVVVCCGSGGVGKTTTAAALALRAAELGRHTVVLTIDPAKRLAQAMGLSELDNTPRVVEQVGPGRLEAMMLDMKRTFDEVVLTHTDAERAQAIFANPFYQSLSSSFSGTQEYMAMEKLGQLRATGSYDLIVVDTPPTRSALDFLDAPARLSTFLDGRLIKMLLAPARAGGRAYVKVLGAGFLVFTRVLNKIIGAQTLTDLSAFVGALETMFGGFRERSDETYRMLASPGTAFVVVATAEPAALREAGYFVDRLSADAMPLAGLVINRVTRVAAPSLTAERAMAGAQALEEGAAASSSTEADEPAGSTDEAALAARLLRLHAGRARLAARQQRLQEGFSSGHPQVAVSTVGARGTDVSDLDGLRAVAAELAGVES